MLNSNVLLVQVRKYGRKQVSCTVLWVLWCTGAITHGFFGAQPKIQSHMRPVIVVNFEPWTSWYYQDEFNIDAGKHVLACF